MKKKTIIFDFDGTIADTFDAIIGISNKLADEFGYRKIAHKDVEGFRDMTPLRIAFALRLPIFKVAAILQQGRKKMHRSLRLLSPIEGIEDVLRQLRKRGYRLSILTSNSKDNVKDFLKYHEMDDIFDFIQSGVSIFGKRRALIKCLIDNNLQKDETVYVGDEIRDIDAARKVGITSVAVAWGLNSKRLLAKHKPDFLADKPQYLISAIQK